jgi:hypothetical protein
MMKIKFLVFFMMSFWLSSADLCMGQQSERPSSLSFGREDATYCMELYFSTSCNHCKDFFLKDILVLSDLLESGKLRIIAYLVPFGAGDVEIALLSSIFRNEKQFYEWLKKFFERQDLWIQKLTDAFSAIDKHNAKKSQDEVLAEKQAKIKEIILEQLKVIGGYPPNFLDSALIQDASYLSRLYERRDKKAIDPDGYVVVPTAYLQWTKNGHTKKMTSIDPRKIRSAVEACHGEDIFGKDIFK